MKNLVAETDYWRILLAPDQGYLGRCYVTLREHKVSLSELSAEEWQDFANVATALEHAAEAAFGAAPMNWACMMNNAYQAADPKPHVHWHFRPRHKTTAEINGITFSDPMYGQHYDRNQRNYVDDQTLHVILDKMKNSFRF